MTRLVSPAAAASVSRVLRNAGLTRAVEHSKGIEYQGYFAEPRGDHVRVDFTPNFWVEPEDALPVVAAGLARCKDILVNAGYDIKEVIDPKYVYGGNPAMAMPVLEIRREAWTRRDGSEQ